MRIGAYEKQKFNYREDYNVIEELKNEETKQDGVTMEEGKTQEAAAQGADKPEPQATESMADYAAELEQSYKEFDERRNQTYVAEESPDAEKWQEIRQMQADKTVVKVKIKEIVKGGAIAYLNELQAFIPASQLSLEYVEKLEDWTGKYIEAYIITADPEKKRLVLSAKELLKERRDAQRRERLAAYKAGDVVEGTVDSLKDYGAFVNLPDQQPENQTPGSCAERGPEGEGKDTFCGEGQDQPEHESLGDPGAAGDGAL